MAYNSTKEYLNIVDILTDAYNIPKNITDPLLGYLKYIHRSEVEDRLSAPMLWIGMYIALASLVCIVAMVADLVHGLRSRKLWFPSKYFRINSAFLTVISVAMKLPVDLTGLMPGYNVDQVAKVGSMAFMCTMMANLLPCLGTMESNELFSNTIAFCVLVVTLVVNVCISGSIQTQMGSLSISMYRDSRIIQLTSLTDISDDDPTSGLAFIYVTLLVVLLIIHICSSLAVLKSMQIIEDRYEEGHDKALADIQPSPGEIVTVEMLKKHVENHWIMAESSSSLHFITTCFYTTSASGVICLLVTILHTFTMFRTIQDIFTMEWDSGFSWSMMLKYCESDYGWSMMVIVIVQSMGVVIGTIAPLSRCFATLSFKVNYKMITNHFKVFKVNGYWTQKLYEWKHASIRLPFRIRSLEVVLETFKRLILNICIGFQKVVVVVCKVIALFPFLFMICCCCKKSCCCFKKSKESEGINDLSGYVLYLEDGMEVDSII